VEIAMPVFVILLKIYEYILLNSDYSTKSEQPLSFSKQSHLQISAVSGRFSQSFTILIPERKNPSRAQFGPRGIQ
jgi:hypothetical protein